VEKSFFVQAFVYVGLNEQQLSGEGEVERGNEFESFEVKIGQTEAIIEDAEDLTSALNSFSKKLKDIQVQSALKVSFFVNQVLDE